MRYQLGKLDKLYDRLRGTNEYVETPSLMLYSILPESVRYKETPAVTESDLVVVARAAMTDISINTEFDILYCASDPREYVDCKAKLVYINERHYVLESLAQGHLAECIISFSSTKPALLKYLNIYREKKPEYDWLLFTTKQFHNKMLAIMDEEHL